VYKVLGIIFTNKMSAGTPGIEVRSPRYGYQSPNVRTRAHEKEELSDLNDRLANYISRMRYLEQQNSHLTAQISTSQESVSREVGNVKAMYETELADTRRLLDESANDRASLKVDVEKLNFEVDDLKKRLAKEETVRYTTQEDLKRTERRLHDKELLYSNLAKERKSLDSKCKDLENQLEAALAELNQVKNKYEQEMLARNDAENRLQTLQEEIAFNNKIHSKEILELRSSNESIRYRLESTDGPPQDMEGLLREKLQELREEFEDEAETARQELEDAYKSKFEDMKKQSDRERGHVSRLIEKNNEIKTEFDKLRGDYSMLEARNIQLQKQLNEFEDMRKVDKEDFRRQLYERDERISNLQERLKELEGEYEALLGIKLSLDLEIAAYRKMLEGEEERLSISTSPQSQARQSSSKRRGTKRARGAEAEEETVEQATVENSSEGNIELTESDADGKFIKLFNKAEQDEALGGYYVQRVVNGRDDTAVEYKFTPKYVLKGGHSVTLWSTSSGVKQKAPTDLVLRNGENWPVGQSIVTSVINHEAEIVAKHTYVASVRDETSGPSRRSRKRRTGGERESCQIM